MTEVNPTIIAISETKLKANFIVNINIPGFIHYPSQTKSGGVGLYINCKLTDQLRNYLKLHNTGCESLFIETPTSSSKPFIVGATVATTRMHFHPFKMNFLKLLTTFKITIMITGASIFLKHFLCLKG